MYKMLGFCLVHPVVVVRFSCLGYQNILGFHKLQLLTVMGFSLP